MKSEEIVMIYGSDSDLMTTKLLEHMSWATHLSKESHIVLKPNLVVARPADGGATTHPEIVEAIIKYFTQNGFKNISIVESSWVGDSTERAFKVHGYDNFAKKYGVKLVDVKKDSYIKVDLEGYRVEMSETIMEADFLISLPVLKGHCQTTMTCALKI